jgi:glycerophosphoryl diester phosphodiesterase
LHLTVHLTVRVLLIAAPFLAAGSGVFLLLLGNHDINYYLAERPPVFYVAAGLIGLVLIAMALVLITRLIGWAFALPMVLFESSAPGKALALSRQRTQGHHKTILVAFALWVLGSSGISMAVLGLVTVIGHNLVDRAGDAVDWLVVAVGVFALLWAMGNLLVNILNTSLFALLTIGVYDRVSGGKAELASKPVERGPGYRLRLRHVMWAATLAAVAATALSAFLVYRIQTDRQVDVIAHRGAAGRAPENTMAAVEAAIEDGTDWVEIDVQETADGEVVVIHDSDFMKIGGEPLKIWDATFEQARAIDIGSWFDPAFSAERIPTLEEVLIRCRGKARVTIELKYYGHDERLEQRVVDIVESLDMESDVAIMSLKHESVEKIRALRPDWRTGLLTATALGDLTRMDTDFLAVNTGMVNRLFVRSTHRSGKDVYVWTVNDALTMVHMMVKGVDGLITDEPALAREVITRYNDLSTVERVLLTVALWLGETPAPIDQARELSGID